MFNFFVTLQTLLADRIDRRDDKGATAVEYGLMVSLIAVAIVATVLALGGRLNALFTSITGSITT